MRIAARLLVTLSVLGLAACQDSTTAPEAPRLDVDMQDRVSGIGQTFNVWPGYGPLGHSHAYWVTASAPNVVDITVVGSPIDMLGVDVTCVGPGTVTLELLEYEGTISINGVPYLVYTVIDEFDVTCLQLV